MLHRFAAAAATLACGLTAASAANARDYQFRFEGYFGGLKIAEAAGALSWSDDRYTLGIEAKSEGFLGWFTDIEHTSKSEGRIDDGPVVETHRYRSRQGKKVTEIELAYTADDVAIVAADPNPATEERSVVPDELKQGVQDPLSAVLTLGTMAALTERCEGRAPVFDGRRRYDTILEDNGTQSYEGPNGIKDTLVCSFRFERIAGYKPEAKRWKGLSGQVWLQRLEPSLPMLPVRLQMTTSYGTGVVHMISANPS